MEKTKKKNYTKRDVSDFTDNKYKFQLFGRWLIPTAFMSLFYKVEYIGRENIPTDRNYVVAANHMSYFDPFLAGEAIQQPLAYMGKKELFDNPILAFLLDGVGCFAVNREKLEVSTIKTALNILKTDKWRLGIFPQGGIRKNRKIEKINRGFAVIAKQMKTDIVPMGIVGCEEYNWNPFKKVKVTVRIDKPISHNQELGTLIDEWGKKVAELTGYEYVKDEEAPDKFKETEPTVANAN